MQDEGYNCEWSQELKLEDSFDEYLNAWIMLHVLRHKFGWTNEKGRGFIFNMSVGYNLEGVLKPNVQEFLDKMANSEQYLKEKLMAAQLSGGEQQRVAVARALMNNPELILADEPSGNLDTDNAKKLHQLFFDLRDQFHQTFVIVTHNEELASLSDRKIQLQDGRVLNT